MRQFQTGEFNVQATSGAEASTQIESKDNISLAVQAKLTKMLTNEVKNDLEQ